MAKLAAERADNARIRRCMPLDGGVVLTVFHNRSVLVTFADQRTRFCTDAAQVRKALVGVPKGAVVRKFVD